MGRMTATPNPVDQGQETEVCYDFSGLNLQSTVLQMHWTPDTVEGMSELVVTPEQPCGTVSIPHNAAALLIIDGSGKSNDLPVAIRVADGA